MAMCSGLDIPNHIRAGFTLPKKRVLFGKPAERRSVGKEHLDSMHDPKEAGWL